MNDLERRQYEMMQRVIEFGSFRTADFPTDSFGGETLAILNRTVNELKQLDAAKNSHQGSKRRGTTMKSSARENLIEDLRAITRCARAMARRVPGIDDKFRLPTQFSNHTLLLTARTFLTDAEPFVGEFVRYELPSNFLEDLRADVEAFEIAAHEQSASQVGSTQADADIDKGIETGLNAVRDLDALIRVKYRDDAAALAAWTRASHVERPARAAKATAATPSA